MSRDPRNFIHNSGMSDEIIDKILYFHPVITLKEFAIFKFLSEEVYKFNSESDTYKVDYMPLYSTEDWPWYMCQFFIKTIKKETDEICMQKPLGFEYLEHLFDLKDVKSLHDYFINGKELYDWEYIGGYGKKKFGKKLV